jgi:SAM-dependent methyltransferase
LELAAMTVESSTFDWTDVASSWDTHRHHIETMKAKVTNDLIAELAIRPGDRVLELGAGTGEFALRLGEHVGLTGSVLATDVSPGMVELLQRTLVDAANITVLQIDARDIELPDGSVDVVVFRMGLMLLGNPGRALQECRRVLKSGGRLGIAVWAGPEHNPWLTCVGMAAMMHGLVAGGPPTAPGGPFSLADPTAVRRLLENNRFTDVTVHDVETEAGFADTDDLFDTVVALAAPLAAVLASALAATRDAVRDTAAQLVDRYRTADGLRVPGRALVSTARG